MPTIHGIQKDPDFPVELVINADRQPVTMVWGSHKTLKDS